MPESNKYNRPNPFQKIKKPNIKLPESKAWKFILGFFSIIGASMVVWYLTLYFSPEMRQQREAQEYWEDLQAEYENDTYGGETPEETLALFIDALEKGDIELASKYTLPEDREELRSDLNTAKQGGALAAVIERVRNLELLNKNSKSAYFVLRDEGGNIKSQIVLDKNGNGVWKISEI